MKMLYTRRFYFIGQMEGGKNDLFLGEKEYGAPLANIFSKRRFSHLFYAYPPGRFMRYINKTTSSGTK